MVLNDLNILMQNGEVALNNGKPCAFFPVKWRIDWSIDSGDTSYTQSGTECALEFDFNWRYSQTGGTIDAVKDGKVLKGTVTDTIFVSNCSAQLTVTDHLITLTLTQTDAGRFSASGSIELIADHYNGVELSAPGVNVLEVLRNLQEFDGTILFTFSDYYGYFPDRTHTATVTMIGEQS